MFESLGLSTWVLVSCVALWTASIALFFIFRFFGKNNLHRGDFAPPVREPAYWPEPRRFGAQVQHEMLCQHIDAVFNSLSDVVEAERMKLKALIAYHSPRSDEENHSETAPPPEYASEPASVEEDTPRASSEDMDITADIHQLARQGMGHAEIARQLGISRNEVVLATKMISSRGAVSRTRRLSAVA
jgi:hypothetical protein